MKVPNGGRLRAAWGAVLSFVIPGLGQVYARAWRVGLILLVVNEALSLAARVLTAVAPPILPALSAVGAVVFASLALMVGAAFDAYRRVRRMEVPARARWFQTTWFAAIILVALGFAADAALPFGWRTFNIPSSSMVPTLQVGDYLVADARSGVAPVRGDVVVFMLPRDPSVDYVKRLIGLPGDRVAIQDGIVILNGTPLARRDEGETVIPEPMSFGTKGHRWTETLPDGRAYGIVTVPTSGGMNTMAERTIPPGQLFMMGDNRDNSQDSRFEQVGLIPTGNVVGVARTLYWSADRGQVLTSVR